MSKSDKSENHYTADYEGPVVREGDDAETRKISVDEVPAGSIVEVEQWVSGDKARAAVALEAEEAKGDDARSTLIHSLKRILDEETGAGIGSGEA